MKIQKMVGAFALTAALAMGSVPAFAAQPSVGPDSDAFSETGNTEIKATVDKYDENVRATVPLEVVVVFGPEGAQDIIGPTSGKYAIKNVGTGDIKVTNVALSETTSQFDFEGIYEEDGTWNNANGAITSGNHIMFTYTTEGNKTYLGTGHDLKDAKAYASKADQGDSIYVADAKAYTAEVIAAEDELNIELAGKAYFVDPIDTGVTDMLCRITYTIAAATE